MIGSSFQQEFGGTPVTLVPGTHRGYRSWRVSLDMILGSITRDDLWRPGTMTATCVYSSQRQEGLAKSDRHRAEEVPFANCTCGFYGCNRPDDNQVSGPSVLQPNGQVMGVIEVGGNLQLSRRGFRAQQAKIVALAFSLPMFPNGQDWMPYGESWFTLPNGDIVSARELRERWKPEDWQLQLRRNYPDVRTYRSRDAMIADYPPVDVSALLPPPEPRMDTSADYIRMRLLSNGVIGRAYAAGGFMPATFGRCDDPLCATCNSRP